MLESTALFKIKSPIYILASLATCNSTITRRPKCLDFNLTHLSILDPRVFVRAGPGNQCGDRSGDREREKHVGETKRKQDGKS